jgi:hypothetical protein
MSEVGNEVGELKKQDRLKLEQQLDKLRTLLEENQEMALQGQTLFDEIKIDFQIFDQKLEMHLSHLNQFKIETDNIQVQWERMKRRSSMIFKLKPIVHYKDIMEDGGRSFAIVKPCGYCNQGFHCMDVVVTSCKHTFHPFCLMQCWKFQISVLYAMSNFVMIGGQVGDIGN